MSYVKSLKSLRKQLDQEASNETVPVVEQKPTGFASRTMPSPVVKQTELKYDPNEYVLGAMRKLRESRLAFSKKREEELTKMKDRPKESKSVKEIIADIEPAVDENGSRPGMDSREGGISVSVDAPRGEKVDYYTSELVKRGVPEHVAMGVVMNGLDESNLNPAAIGDNGAAGGLFQWNGPRFEALKNFAREQGKAWNNDQVQLDFFVLENRTSQKDAWDSVVNSSDHREAAVNFLNKWERPAEKHRLHREAKYKGTADV